MAVLFIPILIGLSQVYPWTWPGVIPVHPVLKPFQADVSVGKGFFTARAIVCFRDLAAVLLFAERVVEGAGSDGGRGTLRARMGRLSAPGSGGLVAHGFPSRHIDSVHVA